MSLIWIALSKIKGLGSKKLLDLYNNFPELNIDFLTNPNNISVIEKSVKVNSVLDQVTDKLTLKQLIHQAEQLVKLHEDNDIKVITIDDELYPKNLKQIEDPPIYLFCKGNVGLLKNNKAIAVVGTRNPTEIGIRSALRVSSIFAQMGYTIVSGLAVGIDTAGHEGALRVKGSTIAVLAGGLDKIYPKENSELAKNILTNKGLLLSETPIGGKTFKQSFVLRDRIQSGLSLGVCPIQTDIVGGTQHTIKYAKQQGRLLFCPIPTEGDIPQNRGILQLINNNTAYLLKSHEDYEELNNSLENIKQELQVKQGAIQKNTGIEASYEDNNSNEIILKRKLDQLLSQTCTVAADLNVDIDELIKKIEEHYYKL